MKALIVIVGPTAVGKSQLALSLAQQLGGEVINADSRQVYRYMDIGTAKPSPESQAHVRHHLLDLINPDQDFSLALYQQAACQAIAEVQGRNKLPLLVGGSGQYMWAVVEGWHIPAVPPDPELRRRLETQAQSQGWVALYAQLEQLDPFTAHRLDPR
ncbi:MAG: tRNA (adenosine(37)-N6)-dimethylallyltransferase MiaA, partial [Chloroflexota bacterium]